MNPATNTTARYRIGVDIGGTFTDFVLLDQQPGALHNEKRLTTPDDPSRAVLAGLTRLPVLLWVLVLLAANVAGLVVGVSTLAPDLLAR